MISCESVPTVAIFQCLPLTQPSILVIFLLHPWLNIISFLKISTLESPYYDRPYVGPPAHAICNIQLFCQYLNRKQQAKLIRNALAFGTDGDKNLTVALGHNFPFALQLRCFIHFKKNVQEKLRDLSLPSHISQQFLDDIFWKCDRNLKIEGLVDSTGVEDFQQKLEALEDHCAIC